jgi:peptidoglycan hydrolase-like protein with peptidoglycan-binding domain
MHARSPTGDRFVKIARTTIWLLASTLAAAAAMAQAPAASSALPEVLTPGSVNDAGLTVPVKAGDKGAAVLRAQILLERAHFSPGEIDAI